MHVLNKHRYKEVQWDLNPGVYLMREKKGEDNRPDRQC